MNKLRILGLAFVLLSVIGLTGAADAQSAAQVCPQRNFQGACIQVITFARIPGQDYCCVYPNPCVVPPGFERVSPEECETVVE
jgi:hypothetical protein